MASLEDKLTEKSAGYCSSSDDDEAKDEIVGDKKFSESRPFNGSSVNTGPKGVIEDWRRFKQLQAERRDEQEKELINLAKKLSMTCRSHAEDEKAKEKETEENLLNELGGDDEFVKQYMQRRMNEMAANFAKFNNNFGKVYELVDVEAFLNAVEQESQKYTVVLHLYEKTVEACETMNGCLVSLAQTFPMVKFCRVQVSLLGLSKKFRAKALPTLQAYRSGQLIGNFVRMKDDLGEDFYADDVESFLKQFGILPDATGETSHVASKSHLRSSNSNDED